MVIKVQAVIVTKNYRQTLKTKDRLHRMLSKELKLPVPQW